MYMNVNMLNILSFAIDEKNEIKNIHTHTHADIVLSARRKWEKKKRNDKTQSGSIFVFNLFTHD